jgi:hypothetical protein
VLQWLTLQMPTIPDAVALALAGVVHPVKNSDFVPVPSLIDHRTVLAWFVSMVVKVLPLLHGLVMANPCWPFWSV